MEVQKMKPKSGNFTFFQTVATTQYATASVIKDWMTACVPGMLQTPEYAAEIIKSTAAFPLAPEALAQRVGFRKEWQQTLHKRIANGQLRFIMIIDESALRRVVGGSEGMRAQLDHILDCMRRPGIEVLVWPLSAGVVAPTLSAHMQLFEFPAESAQFPMAYYEQEVQGLPANNLFEDSEVVGYYQSTFDHLIAEARRLVPDPAGFIKHLNGAEYGAPR